MRSTRRQVGCAVLVGLTALSYGGSGLVGATEPPRAQTARSRLARFQVVPAANLGMYVSRTAGGAIQLDGRTGELTFTKIVSADGTFTLDLTTGTDSVSLAYAGHTISVSRNGRRAVIGADDESGRERVAGLLAGSRAVGLLRAASAAVQESDDTSVGGAAVLTADALVGSLTGDIGAPARIARHLARKSLTGLRRVEVSEESCYRNYERNVTEYYAEAEECIMEAWLPTTRYACSFVWLIQIESEWFHLWACVGFNF
jgi:hypothetical protein